MTRLIQPSFRLCLLLLVAAEIILRGTLSPLSVAAFQCGYHPDSGFQETADGMIRLVPGPARNFHAQVFAKRRPPGDLRIFTLGSSVEYSDAIASFILSNTYPARLGAELRQRGIPAESINLGITGYSSRRNEVLLSKILGYQPSLVILKLDITNGDSDEIAAQRARAWLSWRPRDWIRKSYLVQTGLKLKEERLLQHTLPPRVLAWTYNKPAKAPAKDVPPPAASPFDAASRRAIDESLQLCREHQVPVLLVTQAYVTHDADGHAMVTDYGLDAFAAKLCGPGVAMFSLNQLLGQRPIPETFSDQVHLARPTHQLVARALAELVPAVAEVKPIP